MKDVRYDTAVQLFILFTSVVRFRRRYLHQKYLVEGTVIAEGRVNDNIPSVLRAEVLNGHFYRICLGPVRTPPKTSLCAPHEKKIMVECTHRRL